MAMSRTAALAAVGTAFGLALSGAAQEPTGVFRGGVEMLNLSVTVTDRRGRSVTDLTKDDFIVYEDKKVQEVVDFRSMQQSNETPIGLGLVLDASESMTRNKLDSMRTAVDTLLKKRMRPADAAYFVEFASDVRLVTEWTSDRDAILNAVRRIKVRRGTAIYDAILRGLEVSSKGTQKKQVLLLITDGQDYGSSVNRKDVALAAARSDVIVYALVVDDDEGFSGVSVGRSGLREGSGGGSDANLRQAALELSEVTDATGGRTQYVQGFAELEAAIGELGREFTQQYELAYARPPADRQIRQIAVAVKRPDLAVRHRRTYLAD